MVTGSSLEGDFGAAGTAADGDSEIDDDFLVVVDLGLATDVLKQNFDEEEEASQLVPQAQSFRIN